MFINNFDPVAFTVFSIEIRWYSLAYIFGILFGWLIIKKFLDKDQKYFKNLAFQLIKDVNPGDFNQAMMDFGSTVCKPRKSD